MILEIVLIGLLFVLIGLTIITSPGIYVNGIKWKMRIFWAGEFRTTKKTNSRIRILGAFFLLLGLVILCAHLVLGYE